MLNTEVNPPHFLALIMNTFVSCVLSSRVNHFLFLIASCVFSSRVNHFLLLTEQCINILIYSSSSSSFFELDESLRNMFLKKNICSHKAICFSVKIVCFRSAQHLSYIVKDVPHSSCLCISCTSKHNPHAFIFEQCPGAPAVFLTGSTIQIHSQ